MHFYEKNIVDIKEIYTDYLINMLSPLLYEGIISIYTHSKVLKSENKNSTLNLIDIFKYCLKDINNLSSKSIESELRRIKEFTRSSGFFDNLVKSVIKSYIILLTFNASGKTCILVNEKYHNKINVSEFIHMCYIELAQFLYNEPEIFINSFDNSELQIEKIEICKNKINEKIEKAIKTTIYKLIPIEQVLNEYLKNEYVMETEKIDTIKEDLEKEEQIEKIADSVALKIQEILLSYTKNNINYKFDNDNNNFDERQNGFKELAKTEVPKDIEIKLTSKIVASENINNINEKMDKAINEHQTELKDNKIDDNTLNNIFKPITNEEKQKSIMFDQKEKDENIKKSEEIERILDNMKIESVKEENMKIESMKIESVKEENMKIESIKEENMKIESVKENNINKLLINTFNDKNVVNNLNKNIIKSEKIDNYFENLI